VLKYFYFLLTIDFVIHILVSWPKNQHKQYGWHFKKRFYYHCFICPPSDSVVSEGAGNKFSQTPEAICLANSGRELEQDPLQFFASKEFKVF
jgi:hypothetical protein